MPGPATTRPEGGARPAAILLVGPTGSGKTPLGDLLEARGLWGRPCAHFDFGARLRRCAAGEGTPGLLAPAECAFLVRVLEAGALLEDEHFPIARKVLGAFLRGLPPDGRTRVVLNGLPRHPGQARDMEALVAVEAVVRLACRPEVALERVRTNAGGDRAGRPDGEAGAMRQRLALFEERTAPLVAWYAARGARVETIDVEADTTAEAIRARLEARPPADKPAR